MINYKALVLAGLSAALVSACGSNGSTSVAVAPAPSFALGDPVEGLSQAELEAFHRGRAIFEKKFKPSEGVGPLYNATSCASCHANPVAGGSSKLYRNFYLARIGSGNIQSNFATLPSPVIPSYGGSNHAGAEFSLTNGRFVIPETFFGQEVVTAQRNGIPIFGVGQFEFVTDETILALSDPNDLDGDGISGRFNTDSGTVGRFGVKAQSNNIELFTRAPLQNQMGITSDPFMGAAGTVSFAHAAMFQASTNPNLPLRDDDGVPDPEISPGDLGDLIAFTRFLAPPRPKPFSAAAAQGEMAFKDLGCVQCHLPEIESTRGPLAAYTDLLLHDMGPDLADGLNFGIPQFSAADLFVTGHEFRTQPLWGVSLSPPFLHDGRAETLDQAIQMHGGEAEASRDAYMDLTEIEREDVIAFLEHL